MQIRQKDIVRTVYTYTNHEEHSLEKPKKRGITRIAQTHLSSSKQKPQLIRHSQYIPINNQNFNNSNRDYKPEPQDQEDLLAKVSELEHELFMVKRQKQQLERWCGKQKEKEGRLVESQYVACNEDVEKWVNEKHELQTKIGNMEVQNNFLKMNVGIQQQFMLKVQKENDQLKAKEQEWANKENEQKSVKEEGVQCQLDTSVNVNELTQYSEQVDRATQQVTRKVKQLQSQNQSLRLQKEDLKGKIRQLECLQKQYVQESRDNISKLERQVLRMQSQLETAYYQIQRTERQNSERYESYSKRSNDDDTKYLLKKIHDYQQNNKSLEEENAILLAKLKDYAQQIAKNQGRYSELQAQIQGKAELIIRLRDDIMDLSHKYEEKCRQYAEQRQDKVGLLQELQVQQKLRQDTANQLRQLSTHYTSKFNQIENNLHKMEINLQEQMDRNRYEVEKNRLNQREFEQKMQVFKKDYDVLYNKYIKYKNMCLLMQGQQPQ